MLAKTKFAFVFSNPIQTLGTGIEWHYNSRFETAVMDHRTSANGKETDMSMRMVRTCRFVARLFLATYLVFILSHVSSSQSSESDTVTEPSVSSGSNDPADPSIEDGKDGPSDAERIGEIKESLEQDQKQLLALEQEIDNPESEYALAEKEFRSIKDAVDQCNEKLEAARRASDATMVSHLEQESASLETQRKLAEDRFDLAIEDRKTLREQRQTLKRKIEHDKAALAAITGEDIEKKKDEEDDQSDSREGRSSHNQSERQTSSYEKDRHADDNENGHTSSEPASGHSEREGDKASEDEHNAELEQAVEEAEEKDKEADAAQEETRSIAARLADIQKLVTQEQKELDLTRKKVELASAAQMTLSQELTRRTAEEADAKELAGLRASIASASNRLIKARGEVAEISERLNDHRAELSSLQAEHIVALHEAEKKRQEANEAEQKKADISNPYTLRNILQWLVEHGPRIFAIVAGMFLLNWLASFFATRSVQLVTTSSGRGSKLERENRAKTLVGVFQNASTVGIFITGALMVLEEVGANITVLMGGVAVIGLAVAFGAQNLIKDYFYGFVMLLENQYMLNDSVRVGGVSGQVERITLRMTVLRDSNGIVHFIPNGTINSVSNETHGWSRAVCEIAVGYNESLDRVMDVLVDIGRELHADGTFGRLLLESPANPAIECLGESAVQLKVSVKTLPNKHGAVKQEWLKRIKNRFEQLGIQHPFPQRTVHVQPTHAQQPIVESQESSIQHRNYRQAG